MEEWSSRLTGRLEGRGTGEECRVCIHEVFESQVEQTPDHIAVVCGGDSLTYRQLNRQANVLAHHLRTLGVVPDMLVGLCVDRGLGMLVAILGILKAGGAYVPLDPGSPRDRLASMLEDVQPVVLVAQRSILDRLPAHRAATVCLDELPDAVPGSAVSLNLSSGATSAHLAYCIFTSGSTGRPKGVLVTHGNVVRLMSSTEEWFHFNERDVWTLFHSYAFDFSVWEIWGALLYGGKLVVVSYFISRSPPEFCQLLVDAQVTVLNQTPSAFGQLIQAEAAREDGGKLALRVVIFGGEQLLMHMLKPWFDRHGDARPQLVNMYGITETTVHVTYRPLTLADVDSPSVIGVPIPDLQVYLLDARQQPVVGDRPGEMFVGGAGLARGYLNRPDLTATRFIPDPFRNGPQARLYRTGDLARRLPNGDIEYLGRIDSQVKIRGHRIELGEVESALVSHPQVMDCAVIAVDRGGGQQLEAFFVSRDPVEFSIGSLRQFLGNKVSLPSIPSRFVVVPALPLNSNGKVDRQALRTIEGSELGISSHYDAPQGEQEQTLAGIWERVLQRKGGGAAGQFLRARRQLPACGPVGRGNSCTFRLPDAGCGAV